MTTISGTIKSIQDIMRKDVGVDGDAQRIGQLVWMFFLKILDDREEELEFMDSKFASPLPEKLRWRSWAKDKEGITGDALLDFINNELFPALKDLPERGPIGPRASVVRGVFEDAYNYMKSGTLMRQVVNKIEEIDFTSSDDRHMFGDIYEQILKGLQSAGNAGEFYTPRAVTQFMVDQVDPQLDEIVLDPACGTGGFLTCTVEHKRKHYVKSAKDQETLQKSIHGVEKKSLPHLLCTTNMILHGIDVPTQIKHDNSLSTPIKDHPSRRMIDVILTNPPFGGMEEDGIEKNFPQSYQTRETADLFLYMIVELLRDGGRAAVVLPDGTLFGEGIKSRLKEKLLEDCNLHTIVRLPNGVFNPYTGIKTNLLFFTKGEPTKEVWFYEHPYPEGYKSYSKTKPLRVEEFEPEKEWWDNRVEKENAWKVSIEDIEARGFNLDIDNPNIVDATHIEPTVLLEQFEQNQAEMTSVQDKLKAILAEALSKGDGARSMDKDIFLSQFGHLAQGAGGIKKLRDLILQMAVQGWLVEQDPHDESAGLLLRQIEHEKKRPLKEGVIKKLKLVSGDATTDSCYDIPEGWEWETLEKISSYVQRGKGPKYAEKSSVPVISQKCVQWNGFDLSRARFIDENSLEKYQEERFLQKNDLLWNSTGTGTIGRVNVFPQIDEYEKIVADSHVTVVRPIFINSHYLWCYLASPFIQDSIESDAPGSTNQVELSTTKVKSTYVPIPPLAEQERIVAKVDELMALCDQLERQIRDQEKLTQDLTDSLIHHLTAA